MGDLHEHLGANLYLFSMIISTSFALLLRPSRILKSQCDRLYHALFRYERMKYKNMLPNFWLIPELIDYVYSDPNGDDIEITKEQWLKQVFQGINQDDNQMSSNDIQTIQGRYDYINGMLPKKDAAKIDPLPIELRRDSQNLDIWSILHNQQCQQYLKSVENLIQQLLTTGGKRMMGSRAYIQPAELAHFMLELINLINKDKIPNPDSLVERFLRARFVDDIVKEEKANFDRDILSYAQQILCPFITQKQRVETPEEKHQVDQQMGQERQKLTLKYLSVMVHLARFNIFCYDEKLCIKTYSNEREYRDACQTLPRSIINELDNVEQQMNEYRKPEHLIDEVRTTMRIEDSEKRKKQAEALAANAERQRIEAENRAAQIKRANEALLSEHEKVQKKITQNHAELDSLNKEIEEGKKKIQKTLDDAKAHEERIKKQEEERKKLEEERDKLSRMEKTANDSSNQWLVDSGACSCSGASIRCGVVHLDCRNSLGRFGNWFYYDRCGNQFICDGCRQIQTYDPWKVVCIRCKEPRNVSRVY